MKKLKLIFVFIIYQIWLFLVKYRLMAFDKNTKKIRINTMVTKPLVVKAIIIAMENEGIKPNGAANFLLSIGAKEYIKKNESE